MARLLALSLVAALLGCGEDRECTYDVDCPIGRRCVATQCVSLQVGPGRDAGPGVDAAAHDAAPQPDSGPGLDAGPDASVELACTLTMTPAGGVVLGTAATTTDTPLLLRAGLGLFGAVTRTDPGLVVQYVDEAGSTVLGPLGPLGTSVQPDVAAATAVDGSIAVVWREVDDFLHGALVSDVGSTDLGQLTEGATGTSTPTLARSSDGFVLGWSDRADDVDHLSTRSLDDLGVPQSASVRFGTPDAARQPVLADDFGADVPVVWSDLRSGASLPYAAVRQPDGAIVEETELSPSPLVSGADAVATQLGLFVSWIEPPQLPGGMGSVHVTRLEGDALHDRVIARASSLDGRTSIAWDGDRALVGWHRGSGGTAETSLAAVRPDLEVASTLLLGANSARPTLAADDSLKGVVWLDATTADVRFGVLSCE